MPLRLAVAAFVLLLFAPPARADDTPPPLASAKRAYSSGERLCGNLSLATLTGQSPWLVMGVGGMADYFSTPEQDRGKLGLAAQPWVWGTMLVLVLLVACKDSVLTAFSQLKLPLDALGELMHATGGLVALAYLGVAALDPPPDQPQTAGGVVSGFLSWLLMAAVHLAVWVVFNTFEVVILLNPVPLVDTALKVVRTLLVLVIAGASAIHPVFGFVLALPVILACLWVLPLAVRFAVAGWVCTADVLGRLFGRKWRPGQPVRAFASTGFRGVPAVVTGTVERGRGGLEFVYRRWFLLVRRVPIPWERAAVATGVLPRLVLLGTDGMTLLRFPPRFRGQEGELALTLGLGDVVRHSPRDTIIGWWRRIRAYLARRNEPPQPAATEAAE